MFRIKRSISRIIHESERMGVELERILKSIPEQDRVKDTITKVLGILWNTIKDHLIVKGSN